MIGAVPRFRLTKLNLKFGPVNADIALSDTAREALHELFADARSRRAVLQTPEGRADQPYVTDSIEELRRKAVAALASLGPSESGAYAPITQVVDACNQYLDRVAAARAQESSASPEFVPALTDLRAVLVVVADHVGAYYQVPVAKDLANVMHAEDPVLSVRAKELREARV
jgi:hypothetical protein